MFINIKSLLLLQCFVPLKELQDALSYYPVKIRMPAHVFLTSHPLILFPCQYPFQTHHTLQMCGGDWGSIFKELWYEQLSVHKPKTRHLHKLGVKSYKYESRWYFKIQFEENQPHDCLTLDPCTEWNALVASDNHLPLFSDAL